MNLGVRAMDSRDSKGRGRFFPFIPENHVFPGKIDRKFWYWSYQYYPAKEVVKMTRLFSRRNLAFLILKTCIGIGAGPGLLFRHSHLLPLHPTEPDVSDGFPHLPCKTLRSGGRI